MNTPQIKFQQLLRELFQFDCADLDFGIYRIMNHKRQVIERWVTEALPKAIEEELHQGALAEMQQAQQALEEARQKVLETLGEQAIDAEGNLAKTFQGTKVGREYLEAREKAAHAQPSEALEAAVYNHLYTFFSRYYQDGDFISKRRYSKKERYAIPYNGEEVTLYWANHDQYYVKTAEHFSDYTWKAPNGVSVHFKLQAADVEVNNVKGEKRFFLPVLDGIVWDAGSPLPAGEGTGVRGTLTIPFHYRPLTEQEQITYGNQNQQEKIIEEALQTLPKRLKGNSEALSALIAERRKDGQGNAVSYLAHHLRQYTARNTSDFFIHKDLKGFLSRELDFYLKNEVLNLEELEAAGENLAAGWFQLMRLIKRVGNHIIDFLAQIEDFQKALWEKKKFVTETFYCITVGHIPEEFYSEIAENEAQWQEWRDLFRIHELPKDMFSGDLGTPKGRLAFLKAHPSLLLDTRCFSPDFTDRLLANYDNLDEMTDGLLVHSENWQALNLLLEKYRERVNSVYIDPPYNSPATIIPYKNNYKDSSWLSLMADRISLSKRHIGPESAYAIAIDDYEQHHLSEILDFLMPEYERYTIIVNHHPQGGMSKNVSRTHEYMLVLVQAGLDKLRGREKTGEVEYRSFMLSGPGENKSRAGRPNSFYALLIDPDTNEVVGAEEPPPLGQPYPTGKTEQGYERRYPISPSGEEKVWARTYSSVMPLIQEKKIVLTDNGTVKLAFDLRGRRHNLMSNWTDSRYNAGPHGTALLADIIGDRESFAYPKSVHTVEDAIEAMSWQDHKPVILDFFAGSGTTAHAVINLNREDGKRRKFILVEMGEYFDTVLLPRIKKVTFSPEWKDGKPKRVATQEEYERGPRIVKVIRLESYEDALNNIAFDEAGGQQALAMFGEEYLLRYMLKWESKKSETFLDVEKLRSPFSYKLRTHRDGETREQAVDLPETFNYLIGLDVETRKVYRDDERRYLVYRGITREGRKVAVIWRETAGWTPADYQQDAAFVAEQKMAAGADETFVNGDSFIPGSQSLEGVFKSKMFTGMEG